MKILGYHVQNEAIANSDGQFCSQPPYLDFLLQRSQDCIKVFYHLDFNVACLLRAIGFDSWEVKKLFNKRTLYKNGYSFHYIPHKWFSIKYNRHYAGFSDMSQFLDWHLENTTDKRELIRKAKDAQEAGQTAYKALTELGLHPKSLTSPVSVFEKEVMSTMDLPTCDDIPDEATIYANECCHGSWLETFKKGHWNVVYDYDITAAYAYYTAQLLDLRFGQWIKSEKYIPEARYGYCKGMIKVWKTPSPIIYRASQRHNYNGTGEWSAFEHKGKIDFIRERNIGDFELEDGWFWIPDKEVYPLKPEIERLYAAREKYRSLEREVIKRTSTGIWGKFLEVHQKGKDFELGDFYNPVWAAEVENPACIEVARFIYDNQLFSNLLSIAVDGVVTSSPVHSIQNNGMGSWRLSSVCPGFIISSGVVSLRDNTSTKDFSLRYYWLMNQIEKYPEQSEYTMTKLSPITVGKAVARNQYEKLGDLEKITKYVDVGYEMKRDYDKVPSCGKELLENKYESFAIDVSRLQIQDLIDTQETEEC